MKEKSLKIVAIVLGVVLAIVGIQDISMVSELSKDKKDLTVRIQDLQVEYNNLTSDYEEINAQLDSSRQEVALLIEKIQKTEAANRAKMRKYEKELGTLRSMMRSYVIQIDSLNSQNKRLAADLASSRAQLAQSTKANEALSAQVEDLSLKVSIGATIKARSVTAGALNSSGRATDRSSRVTQIVANICLSENELAAKGNMNVYVRVMDPDGALVLDGSDASFKINGETVLASAAREIDYQGAETELSIYVAGVDPFVKGVYTVEVYSDKSSLGSAEVSLR